MKYSKRKLISILDSIAYSNAPRPLMPNSRVTSVQRMSLILALCLADGTGVSSQLDA